MTGILEDGISKTRKLSIIEIKNEGKRDYWSCKTVGEEWEDEREVKKNGRD